MTCCLNVLSGKQKAEWLLRWGMGLFLLVVGIGKIAGGVSMFSANMTSGFSETFLPVILLTGFFYIIPFLEITLGALLLLSWKRECVLWTAGVLIIIFIFGHLLKGEMSKIPSMFIYLGVIAATLSLPAAWEIGCCSGGKCQK